MDKAKRTLKRKDVFGAGTLLSINKKIAELRANSLLREDEWKALDETVADVIRSTDRITVWNDFMARGLTEGGYSIGKTLYQYEQVSDLGDATRSMSGLAEGENETVDFTTVSIPIPVIHKDFSLHERRLVASREHDEPLDTRQVRYATEKVKESIEALICNGGFTSGGDTIYGFTTHGNRQTHSGSTWGTAGNIMDDILSAIQTLHPYVKGPYTLYTNSAQYWQMMEPDPDGTGDMTVMERVMDKTEIEAVKATEELADGDAILANLDPKYMQLIIAEDIQAVNWSGEGGWLHNTKVLAVMTPALYADDNGQTGWCHISGIS